MIKKYIESNTTQDTDFGTAQIAYAKTHLKMMPNETLRKVKNQLLFTGIGLLLAYLIPLFFGTLNWSTTSMFFLLLFLILRRWYYFQPYTKFSKVELSNNQATIASHLMLYFRKEKIRLQHNLYDPYTFHLLAKSKHDQYDIVTFICIDNAILMNHHFTSYSAILLNNNKPYQKLQREVIGYLQLQDSISTDTIKVA